MIRAVWDKNAKRQWHFVQYWKETISPPPLLKKHNEAGFGLLIDIFKLFWEKLFHEVKILFEVKAVHLKKHLSQDMKRMISLWLGNQWDICFNVQPRNNAASSKGNRKEGCFLSLLSRAFRMGFSKVFCMSRTSWVWVLNYVVEVDLLRTLTFRAKMSYGDVKNPIWGWILPLFSRHRLPEWLILPHSRWGAGAGGCAAAGMPGRRSKHRITVGLLFLEIPCLGCRLPIWRGRGACVDISTCGMIASVCPSCFLSPLWSPWKPCWVPVSCLSSAYAMNLGFSLQAVLCSLFSFPEG